jgi:hypothetical protein
MLYGKRDFVDVLRVTYQSSLINQKSDNSGGPNLFMWSL